MERSRRWAIAELSQKPKLVDTTAEIMPSLISFEDSLRQYGKPVYDQLQKGLKRTDIRAALAEAGLRNSVLEELFSWRNGTAPGTVIGQYDLCAEGRLMPLDEALRAYQEMQRTVGDRKLFPLLSSGGGDYLLLAVDGRESTHGMLFFYSPSLMITTPESMYDSPGAFFKTTAACLRLGVYVCDRHGMMTVDFHRLSRLAKTMNPESDYWKNEERNR